MCNNYLLLLLFFPKNRMREEKERGNFCNWEELLLELVETDLDHPKEWAFLYPPVSLLTFSFPLSLTLSQASILSSSFHHQLLFHYNCTCATFLKWDLFFPAWLLKGTKKQGRREFNHVSFQCFVMNNVNELIALSSRHILFRTEFLKLRLSLNPIVISHYSILAMCVTQRRLLLHMKQDDGKNSKIWFVYCESCFTQQQQEGAKDTGSTVALLTLVTFCL